MVTVTKLGIVLQKSKNRFEAEGVLNPAVIAVDNLVHVFYRAVGKNNFSTIGYCRLTNFLTVSEQADVPLLFPQFDYESQGMEDPRIVKIDERYYLTYTAYDGVNALGALATSTDLIHFKKEGVITPQFEYSEFRRLAETRAKINEKYFRYNDRSGIQEANGKHTCIWDKNVIFFPRRINGYLYFLHRIRPDIQIVQCKGLGALTTDFWQNYFIHLDDWIVLTPRFKHEISYIGGGCPPIETAAGWLLIYHSVYDTVKGYVYCACAALLDLENPCHELARLPYPLFKPDLDWEINGMVNNVCFPTGAVVDKDTLYIYYGAADETIACATVSIAALLLELTSQNKQQTSS